MMTRMMSHWSRIVRALALTVLLVPAAAAQDGDKAPPMWILKDADSTVYLFGSIHMMKPDVPWFSSDVKKAFKKAHTVTFEVDMDDLDPAEVQRLMMQNSRLPEGETLSDYLSETTMAELMKVFEPAGVPRDRVETLRPWFAALQFGQLAAMQAGFSPQFGIDKVLTDRAKSAGKDIEGLETFKEQIELLMMIDELAGNGAFEAQMEQYEDAKVLFEKMKTRWMAGDTEGLVALLLEPSEEMAPKFHEAVFADRNKAWVPQIEAMLDEPGPQFVVMGAGHLIGDNSVVDLLEERGHTVTRQ